MAKRLAFGRGHSLLVDVYHAIYLSTTTAAVTNTPGIGARTARADIRSDRGVPILKLSLHLGRFLARG
jgi:hypothetical protein